MNRHAFARARLGGHITGYVVNKQRPGEGEAQHHTITLRQADSTIVKVIVSPPLWEKLQLGDYYELP